MRTGKCRVCRQYRYMKCSLCNRWSSIQQLCQAPLLLQNSNRATFVLLPDLQFVSEDILPGVVVLGVFNVAPAVPPTVRELQPLHHPSSPGHFMTDLVSLDFRTHSMHEVSFPKSFTLLYFLCVTLC